MKRFVLSLLCVSFLLSACFEPSVGTVRLGSFRSNIVLEADGNQYSYALSYTDPLNCSFNSISENTPVSFIWSQGELSLSHGGITQVADQNVLKNCSVVILRQLLNQNANCECAADYNGNYVINSTSEFGEYKLTLNPDGLPKALELKQRKITVNFFDTEI